MRLSVSNIAWSNESRHAIFSFLSENGVGAVEIAPTKIAAWELLDEPAILSELGILRSYGLEASSYQALFFGRPDCHLLGDAQGFEKLKAHTVKVAQLAERMSQGGPGVFGAPQNRLRGPLTELEAADLGAERLSRLAEAVAPYGFVLALEAAPAEYGGNFLMTAAACVAMVRTVDHSALRLHLDAGCLALTGESGPDLVLQNAEILGHVHLSKPGLTPIERTDGPTYTKLLGTLSASGYCGWTAIEMREAADAVSAVKEAVATIRAALAYEHSGDGFGDDAEPRCSSHAS